MPRLALLAGLLLAAGPAWAQLRPAPPLGPSAAQSRAFALKNLSHQAIVAARAFMTDGETRMLTYAPIEPGQVREVAVPRKACLAAIAVQLNDGRSLRAVHLNDCRSRLVIVRDKGIDIQGTAPRGLRHAPLPHPADRQPQR